MKCKPGSCSVVSSQTGLQCFWRRTSATRCRGSRYLYACSCPHFSLQTQMPLRKKCTARLASPRGMLWLSSRTWLWMVRDCANFIMCRCCSHCTLQRPQARAAFKLPHSAVANMHIQHVMCQSRRTEKQQHSRAPPASPSPNKEAVSLISNKPDWVAQAHFLSSAPALAHACGPVCRRHAARRTQPGRAAGLDS